MIELKEFSTGFKEKALLKDVDITFPSEELTALIGKNGSGKSTLMKALCGLNEKYNGSIEIDGKEIKEIPKLKLASEVSYVNTQRPRIANLKSYDVVALGRTPFTGWNGRLSDKDKQKIEEAIKLVGMEEFKDRYLQTLSDGECQKIMIARAIAQDTPIILLDEPTSFLDLPTRHEIVALLKRLTEQNKKTIIFSTHELDIALRYADNIALIDTPNLLLQPTTQMIDYLRNSSHPFSPFLPSK